MSDPNHLAPGTPYKRCAVRGRIPDLDAVGERWRVMMEPCLWTGAWAINSRYRGGDGLHISAAGHDRWRVVRLAPVIESFLADFLEPSGRLEGPRPRRGVGPATPRPSPADGLDRLSKHPAAPNLAGQYHAVAEADLHEPSPSPAPRFEPASQRLLRLSCKGRRDRCRSRTVLAVASAINGPGRSRSCSGRVRGGVSLCNRPQGSNDAQTKRASRHQVRCVSCPTRKHWLVTLQIRFPSTEVHGWAGVWCNARPLRVDDY